MKNSTKAIFILLCLLAGAAEAATVTYTASGNWTAPAGVTSVTVETWGGGGGGGAATGNPAKGGGGAGGQYAKKVVTVTPGNTYAIVAGAGGVVSNTTAGGAGGDSTFAATTVVAKGGAGGGLASTNSSGGTAGTGSSAGGVGDVVYAGGSGSAGVYSSTGGAGGGGAGSGGAGGSASGNNAGTGTATGGGNGGAGIAGTTSANGNAGSAMGGGGGGGNATGTTDRSGGAGAGGQVSITYAIVPSVTTNAASALTTTGATLNGTVSSNGAITTVTFDYGLTTAYGSTVAATPSPLAAGASGTAVSAALTGLTCNTIYHYRVNGVNSAGTTNGGDLTFATSFCPFNCSPPSNAPAGVTCQCDAFARATLNPSTIFNSNWTVSTSDATGILPSIVNSGYLRLTNNTGNNAKAATVPGIFPAAGNYISVEFQQYAYNGTGADGIAVTLSDYSVPAVPGAYGGSLGYAQETGIHDGFAGGWLGVGLDEYGNYQSSTEGRLGGLCTTAACMPQSVGARGSGTGQTNYRWLGGTTTLSPTIDNRTSTSASYGYFYQIVVDARNEPTSTSITVNRDSGGGYTQLINIPNVYAAANAQGFTQAAVPANWQISFTGSTGGSNNIHEIGSLRICASTMAPPGGGSAGGFNAIDEAYGTPPLAVQNYLSGHIYTKLVGTPFKLNVAALSNSQILTTYALAAQRKVTVKLVDNSDSLTNSALDCTLSCTAACIGKSAVAGGTQSVIFAAGAAAKGQMPSPSFTINTAYQKLVAVMIDDNSPSTSACSTDSFSVRPVSLAMSSSATNTAATGAPIFKAGGDNFTLSATTSGVSGNYSGYNGIIKMIAQAVSPSTSIGALAATTSATTPTGNCPVGTPASTFPAATPNTPSSTVSCTFTYSEAGAFQLTGYTPDAVCTVNSTALTAAQCNLLQRGGYDDTWTGVDSVSTKNDCVVNSYSNIKDATGKYGCNFGLAATSVFGRFIPDHFETIVKYDTASGVFMPCPAGLTCPASRDSPTYSWSYADAAARTTDLTHVNADIGKLAKQLDNNTFWTLTAITPVWSQYIYSGIVYSGMSSTVPGQPFITQIIAENASNVTTLNYQGVYARAVTLTTWDTLGGTTTSCATCLANGSVASSVFSAGVALTPAASSASALSYTFATVPTAPTDIYMRAAETSAGDGVTAQFLATPANSLEGAVKVVSGHIKVSNAYGSELLPLTLSAAAQYYSANGWLNGTTDSITQLTLPTSYTVGTGSSAVTLNPASSILASGLLSINLGKPSAGAGIATVTPTTPGYLSVIPGTATFGVYKNNNKFIYRRESY